MTNRAKAVLPILALLTGIAIAASLMVARPEVERQEVTTLAPLVRVMEVELSELTLSVESQGTVKPRVESSIVAQVAGRIDWVSPQFAEGGFFKRGQKLIRIEDRDFRLAVSQAEAQVAQALVQVHREQAEADLAKQEWADLGTGAPTSLALREPQLAEAQARVQSAEAALEKARLDLERTQIGPTFDGREPIGNGRRLHFHFIFKTQFHLTLLALLFWYAVRGEGSRLCGRGDELQGQSTPEFPIPRSRPAT